MNAHPLTPFTVAPDRWPAMVVSALLMVSVSLAVAFPALATDKVMTRVEVQHLIERLGTEDEFSEAVRALGDAGPVAVEPLVAALDGANDRVHAGVLQALMRIGSDATAAVPKIIEILEANPGQGMFVIPVLEAIGPGAADALPLLTEILYQDDSFLGRTQAARAVAAIAPRDQAVPALMQAAHDQEAMVRKQALLELVKLQVVSEEATQMYVDLLADGDPDVRRTAAEGVALAAPTSQTAVERLIPQLTHEDTILREKSAEALGAIGAPLAEPAIPGLIGCLNDEMYQVRKAAGVALGKIGEPAGEAIPLLIEDLDNEDKWVQVSAAEGLQAFGPLAVEAVPALEALTDHKELTVMWGARHALQAIQGGTR